MSVVSSVKSEDQDGFYGGQIKRPLSIIEENDGDEGDAETTPVKGNYTVNPAPEINMKEITTIETKIASTTATKPAAKSNGAKKNDLKKKPQNIDTSRAKGLTSGSKPKSSCSEAPISADSKTTCKFLLFSKNVRIVPKTDPNPKAPPPVAPKPKTPSPSPSKLKSPSFPSQTGDRHFEFHKSPACSQSKKTDPKSKTSDAQTSEDEVARSMKNLVKRTVSKIENHVASMSSAAKQKVKVDPPRRKISKEEAPFKEKGNNSPIPKSSSEAEKPISTSTSAPSSNDMQELILTLTPASPTEADKATNSPDSIPLSDNTETPTDTQTSTSSYKERENTIDSPDSLSRSDKKENSMDTKMGTPSSEKTVIIISTLTSTTMSNETENPTATENSVTASEEKENPSAGQNSMPVPNEAENPKPTQTSPPVSNETENSKATGSSPSVSNETENPKATRSSPPVSNETENPKATRLSPQESSETENTTATQMPTPLSHKTENSSASATFSSTPPIDGLERPTTPRISATLFNGTEDRIAISISTPNYETEKQIASTMSTSSRDADQQTSAQTSQPPSREAEKSPSIYIEVEDSLRYQGESSQLSTSESSTPEFTTPPSSPPLPQSRQISNVVLSPLLSSKTSHSSPELTRINSKPGHILSDGQGLARIREAAETLKLTSSSHLPAKASPSPPSRRVPFSFRQSPKLNHRPFSEAFSFSTLNNAKPKGSFNLNVLSLPSQFSTKGDSGTSDSENEDKSQNKNGEKSRIAPRSPFLAPKFHPRRGSYFFKRRLSSESLASLSENESTDNAEEPTPISASDFNKLKETADRLHLSTRRPSVMQWRQQYVESPGASGFLFRNGMNGDSFDEKLTSERKQKIDEALDWLRNELQEMRSHDQLLARQLLTIRNDIHQLKLRRCTTEHQELLDDFKLEIEEQQEFSDVLDIPQPIYEDNPLKHIGVTRLNISARRFSAC